MISMTWPQYLRGECTYRGWVVHLSCQEAEVLLVLLLRSVDFASADLLAAALYGDDPKGGREDAHCAVRIIIMRLRAKLPGLIGGAHGWGYHLDKPGFPGCRAQRAAARLSYRKEKNHDRHQHQGTAYQAGRSPA
jgi:hypothetical protein